MKKISAAKTLIALAVAIAAAVSCESLATAQPVPAPATAGALPASIPPGTPAAEVVKLAQAGVDAGVIQNYISSCPGAFNLDADQIISLTDAGVSSDMVNAMIAHDKNLSATAVAPPTAPSSGLADNTDTTPPPTEVTMTDFNNTLSPYGQWIQVDGYGRCWRPTTMVYDAAWQPYCDRGRWVYTDCGWYWDSDYSWGITFHYGRWFNNPRYGWCWWPDTVWAPSWVTWRSSSDYCGWAPLPPFTVYQPGIGFTYRGASVAVGFDFGLAANCFTFVSVGNFCQPHPRYYCVPRPQVAQIYNRTTIINNYNSRNRSIVNNGVSVATIGAAAHHPIQPVSIGTLVNSSRHGWPASNQNRNTNRSGAGSPFSPATSGAGSTEINHVPNQHNNVGERNNSPNTGGSTGHRPPFNQPTQPVNRPDDTVPSSRPQNSAPPSNRQDQRQSGWSGRNDNNTPAQNFTAPASDRSEHYAARQNYAQSAPRNVAPASAPAPNGSPNGGGKPQNWPSQNH